MRKRVFRNFPAEHINLQGDLKRVKRVKDFQNLARKRKKKKIRSNISKIAEHITFCQEQNTVRTHIKHMFPVG